MRYRTMYAVCAEESLPQQATALFDDRTQAEKCAGKMSVVVPVTIDTNTISIRRPSPKGTEVCR